MTIPEYGLFILCRIGGEKEYVQWTEKDWIGNWSVFERYTGIHVQKNGGKLCKDTECPSWYKAENLQRVNVYVTTARQ